MLDKVIRGLAAKMAEAALVEAAEDEEKDMIRLVKEPGKEGNRKLNVKITMEFSQGAIIPYYVGRILQATAEAADILPKEMAKLALTFLELSGDYEEETETTITEEDR